MCVVDGGKPGVDSRDEGKHAGRNDLLFVDKMKSVIKERVNVRDKIMARIDGYIYG